MAPFYDIRLPLGIQTETPQISTAPENGQKQGSSGEIPAKGTWEKLQSGKSSRSLLSAIRKSDGPPLQLVGKLKP